MSARSFLSAEALDDFAMGQNWTGMLIFVKDCFCSQMDGAQTHQLHRLKLLASTLGPSQHFFWFNFLKEFRAGCSDSNLILTN